MFVNRWVQRPTGNRSTFAWCPNSCILANILCADEIIACEILMNSCVCIRLIARCIDSEAIATVSVPIVDRIIHFDRYPIPLEFVLYVIISDYSPPCRWDYENGGHVKLTARQIAKKKKTLYVYVARNPRNEFSAEI